MTLTAGSKLGPYEILAPIGAGGMGEVYSARDPRVDRDVAIKVSTEQFNERFEREIRAVASLNHSNICTLYDVGPNYLVMELVEGSTLADRIKQGPIPLEESLEIARQIADALEAAHEKSIIHRDLKPANIKIKPDGTVKVLDFGLAKVGGMPVVSSDNSPTLSVAQTAAGVILGTAAYMSPEQAKGKTVDKRADIWSFGVVLYEMVTGKQLFQGETISDILAEVIKGEPDWEKIPTKVLPLLKRCLQKDPKKRLRDIGDAMPLLEGLQGAAPVKRWGLVVGLACLLLGSIATGIVMWRLKPSSESKPISRVSITLPPNQRLQKLDTPMLGLSPDGTQLAYVSNQGGAQQIYLRRMDSFDATPIAGTERGESPFFSPDGQWLGFCADGKLMKVPIQGGAPLPLSNAAYPEGMNWGDNGTIVVAPSFGVNGLVQVSEAGGSPTPVTRPDAESEAHRWPQLLPGGQAVLFTAWRRNVEDSRIMVHSVRTGQTKMLMKGGTDGRYVPTGHLVYVRQGNLFAVPFDLERLELKGSPVPILEGVMQSFEGVAQFSFSTLGSLAYVRGGIGATDRVLVWVDRSGREQPLGVPPQPYDHPRLSPDGDRVAVTIEGANDEIWTYDIPNRKFNRLTFQGRNQMPIWTPDGKRITFHSDQGGVKLNLFWMAADGSGAAERLTESEYAQIPWAWSPDGKSLVFSTVNITNVMELSVLPLGGGRKPYPFFQTRFNCGAATFSPDGHWIAYASEESGKPEIYVRPIPGATGVWQVSTNGGSAPVWARSGELFYRNGDNMMAVDVKTAPIFKAGVPRLLFEGKFAKEQLAYDVTPDGKRFLMLKSAEQEQTSTQINIVLNWFEELKRRVQSGMK